MGTLIRRVSGTSSVGYGVNVLELLPPGQIRAGGLSVVGVVGDFPWGPLGITEISTPAELFATFCPAPFDAAGGYTAMRAFLGKTFPSGMLVCRIPAASAATAALTYDDASAGDSVTVTAKYQGVLGNSISVAWSVNADSATARDATVTIGTGYSVLYESVATIVSTALVVTDPGDPYVTFSKASGATLVPAAAAAAALAGGANGTATAANYVGTSSSIVGIRKFYPDSIAVDVLFVAECPSDILDAVNTGLKAFATDTMKGMVVLSTVNGQTVASAKTYVGSYRSDRCVYAYPRVLCTDGYDPALAEIEVDGNAYAAACIVNCDPWKSPGGAEGAQFLTGITGLENEDLTAGDMDALNAKGITPFAMITSLGGAILRKAVTTSLTSGLTKIRRRRTTDYLMNAIAERGQFYSERAFDGSFANQTLGPISGGYISEIGSFLNNEQALGHIASFGVDAFSAATQLDLDAGRWTVAIAVRTFSDMDEIVLSHTIGDSVTTA